MPPGPFHRWRVLIQTGCGSHTKAGRVIISCNVQSDYFVQLLYVPAILEALGFFFV